MSLEAGKVMPVKATPHKRFFIDMITRDISLGACVLDLIDNSVDGATRATDESPAQRRAKSPKPHPLSSGSSRYRGYKIELKCSRSSFRIRDNCDGIPVDIACEYAFNFGRDPSEHTDADTEAGIGIYGIGMKRALFKLGKEFEVKSNTIDDGFVMNVDVDAWAAKPQDWNLELTTAKPSSNDPGTTIEVKNLHPSVAQELDTDAFVTRLIEAAARTYAVFLDQGLELRINGAKVKPTEFTFLQGRGFQPLHQRWKESVPRPSAKPSKVEVEGEIWAGAATTAAGARPDSEEDEDASAWGWYVLCNNRVVLSADKTERTGWGLTRFPQWHPQYNGFIGIVSFRSEEPYALPWTTTKNDIDVDSIVYRRARARMQEAARAYISYSRTRKANLEGAKKIERSAPPVRATEVSTQQQMKTPAVPGTTQGTVNILYQKPKRQVAKAAAALGDPALPAAQVGIKTFDYFYANKVE